MRKPLSVYKERECSKKEHQNKMILSYEGRAFFSAHSVPPMLENLFIVAKLQFIARMENLNSIRATLQEADNRENLDIVTLDS